MARPRWYHSLSRVDKDLFDGGCEFDLLQSKPSKPQFVEFPWLNDRQMLTSTQHSRYDRLCGDRKVYDNRPAVLVTSAVIDTLALLTSIYIARSAAQLGFEVAYLNLADIRFASKLSKLTKEEGADVVVAYGVTTDSTFLRLQTATDFLAETEVTRILVMVGDPLTCVRRLHRARFAAVLHHEGLIDEDEETAVAASADNHPDPTRKQRRDAVIERVVEKRLIT